MLPDEPAPHPDLCPVSGWPVLRRPEWDEVQVGEHHSISLRLIGKQILYTEATGAATPGSTTRYFEFLSSVVDAVVPRELPFVWIADYSESMTTTRRSRKRFAEAIAAWTRLERIIFCRLPPLMALAARFGRRLGIIPFPIEFANSYEEAIGLALQILGESQPSESSRLAPAQVQTSSEWLLQRQDLSARFEILDSSVLHLRLEGVLAGADLDALFQRQGEIFELGEWTRRPYSVLIGLEGLQGMNRQARESFFRRLREWREKYSFQREAFYGPIPWMRAVIKVAASQEHAEATVHSSFEEGREFIAHESSTGKQSEVDSRSTASEDRDRHQGELQPYIDDLLLALGGISWDPEGKNDLATVDLEHPFTAVYEAIELVKSEIDDLLAERARAEEDRARLQERLARSSKMEALGLLAGGVAHDLNNVLSAIVGYPDLLLMRSSLDERDRNAVEAIRESGEQAAAIVQDLLTLSRGVAAATEAVSLNSIVEHYLDSPELAALLDLHPPVQIRTELSPELAPVQGSLVHLRKVVANLVGNAVEAIRAGKQEGIVTISTSPHDLNRPIVTRYEEVAEGEYVVLRVQDDGPGIAKEDLDRIFEPFFSKKVMGRSGTGLGLTLVWNAVRDHRGYIDLSSSDQGTRFDLYFPMATEPALRTEKPVSLEEIRGHGERILVVDDVASQRATATSLLESLGYRVETAESGESAIRRIEKEVFDLVLLDMIMDPGINGRETYERIVAIRPGQKAVITSGFSPTDEVRKAQEMGAGSFVSKPFTVTRIGLALKEELARDRKASVEP